MFSAKEKLLLKIRFPYSLLFPFKIASLCRTEFVCQPDRFVMLGRGNVEIRDLGTYTSWPNYVTKRPHTNRLSK